MSNTKRYTDAPEEMGERYRDCHGDVWHRMESGEYTLMPDRSAPYGGSELSEVRALYGPLVDADDVIEQYGPLVRESDGAEFGAFSNEDPDALPENPGSRAEALTVGVMLAKMIHGDQGHPANVAGTADTLARFILGER